jgi:hypothetical protein
MGSLRTLLLTALAGCALSVTWANPPAPAAQPPKSGAKASSPPALDLAPPDIRRVMPKQDLEGPTLNIDEPEDPPPTVEVNGEHPAPYVPGGIASIWWGFTHPSQAWRIFTPVQ